MAREYQLRETLSILQGSLMELFDRLKASVTRAKKVAEVKIVRGVEDFELDELENYLNQVTSTNITGGGIKRELLERILKNLVCKMVDFRTRVEKIESAVIVLEREILKRELEEAKK